jgi:hypothetical protein
VRRCFWAIGLAVAALAATAAPAIASTTYYVAPAGTGTACTQAAPCGTSYFVSTLVPDATAGDVIMLAGGDGSYGTSASPITAQLILSDGVTVEGTPGEPMPVLYMDNTTFDGVDLAGTSSLLQYVEIQQAGSSVATYGGGDMNRVIADALPGDNIACYPLGTAVVTDTVCLGNYGVYDSSSGGGGLDSPVLRNDTIYGTATALYVDFSGGVDADYTLSNSIIRSGSGADISTAQSGGSTVTITLDHSNYGSVSAGAGTSVTAAGSGTNQTAAPVFAGLASGNVHEAASSPTIGRGVDSAADGALDLDGNAREINGVTDIGAYEYGVAPAAVSSPATGVSGSAATLAGSVNPNGSVSTSYEFQYGSSTAYGTTTTAVSVPEGAAPVAVAAGLSGLAPGTTYHYRIVATDSVGTSYGADETFTTTTATLTNLTIAPASFATTTSASAARARRHKSKPPRGGTIGFTLNEAATVTFQLTAIEPGRKSHGRCGKTTRHNRRHKRCTFDVPLSGAISDPAAAGVDTLAFNGWFNTRRLPKGSYMLTATPSAQGLSGAPEIAYFHIVGSG